MKQMKELRDMQNAAKEEKFEAEKNGVRVVANGTLQVENVTIEGDISGSELEDAVREAVNDALKKAQMAMAQKFQGMMG